MCKIIKKPKKKCYTKRLRGAQPPLFLVIIKIQALKNLVYYEPKKAKCDILTTCEPLRRRWGNDFIHRRHSFCSGTDTPTAFPPNIMLSIWWNISLTT